MYAAWPMNKKVASFYRPSRLCEQANSLSQSKHSNMIIMACCMCADDESNSLMKWLAKFISLISCGTNPLSHPLMCAYVCLIPIQ